MTYQAITGILAIAAMTIMIGMTIKTINKVIRNYVSSVKL